MENTTQGIFTSTTLEGRTTYRVVGERGEYIVAERVDDGVWYVWPVGEPHKRKCGGELGRALERAMWVADL